MKKRAFFCVLILAFLFLAGTVRAEIKFSNVNVYAIRNGTAKISWDTFGEPTKAFVYYGTSADKLDKTIEYGVYDFSHESTIYGLEKDITYYYKIVAMNQAGEAKELFLQTFSTKDMPDTITPEFISTNVLQTTKDAVAIFWETNEETRAEIKFSPDPDNLNRGAGDGDFKKRHEVIIQDLDSDQKYYFKIIAEDRGGNKTSIIINARTGIYLNNKTELTLDNIKPMDFDPAMIFAREVTLSWKTNMIARCKIRYGAKTNEYNKELEANNKARLLDHAITITGLEPTTTYYYKLECYDSFYGKRKETKEYTFTTLNPSLVIPKPQVPPEPYKDTDGDTLSDTYEKEIGTNPNKKDTDGDSYNDDVEIKYGYDPLIPGRTRLRIDYYMKPILIASKEAAKDKELKALIKIRLGNVKISIKNWRTLLNAYVYGNYPAEAIIRAIQLGGRTVHPTIGWESWQKTSQYKEYMNK